MAAVFGKRVSESYELSRVVGRGSFGAALLVSRRSDGAGLVIKRVELGHMNEKQVAQARNECAVLRELVDGPYIVRVVECFEEEQQLWLVMDYAEGGDLGRAISQAATAGAPFQEAQVIDWFVQLCLALSYAHGRKVLHRDIKPQNIFLSRGGTNLLLGDFGISRVLTESLA